MFLTKIFFKKEKEKPNKLNKLGLEIRYLRGENRFLFWKFHFLLLRHEHFFLPNLHKQDFPLCTFYWRECSAVWTAEHLLLRPELLLPLPWGHNGGWWNANLPWMYSWPLFQELLSPVCQQSRVENLYLFIYFYTRHVVIKFQSLNCVVQVTGYSRHVMIIIGFWYFRGGSVYCHSTFCSGMWIFWPCWLFQLY